MFIRHEYEPGGARSCATSSSALRAAGLLGDDVSAGRRLRSRSSPRPAATSSARSRRCSSAWRATAASRATSRRSRASTGCTGKPTLMNNVETFADVPIILERGAEWWKEQGVNGGDRAEVLRGLGPRRAARRVLRARRARRSRELIELAGGVRDGAALGAVQPGGASSNFLGPDSLDVPLDFDAARRGRARCSARARWS